MRNAVRSTIVDLKETNLSIERFVPHAFLAMIGKPSIVVGQAGRQQAPGHDGPVLRHQELHDPVGDR